jgi:primary-amine oxidase
MNPLAATSPTTSTHPLEPLSADEMAATAAILTADRGLGPEARFVFIMLHEPPKDTVRSWTPEAAVPREAFVVMRDRTTRGTYEAIVSLSE